jgi:hypothetical protein
MKMRHAGAALAALGLGSGLVLAGPSATAAPPSNGCPSGYLLLSVEALSDLGYQVPGLVDDPASGVESYGRPANGDGWVCARPMGNQTGPYGQIYMFTDNQLP